jgi:RNA polymerase sigma-70 factor (ECF subfamily)
MTVVHPRAHVPAELRAMEPSARDAAGSGTEPARRLRAIVDAHHAFVWRSLRRLGVAESAVEDGAQQVLVVAARRLADIREGAERAFLFAAALRVASDLRRAARRRLEDASGDAFDAMEHPGRTPEDAANERDARRLLGQVLEAMPLDIRTVFILFELEEMSTSEVAATLEIPQGTVASRLRRGRELFEQNVARINAQAGAGT